MRVSADETLSDVWVHLTTDEAVEILQAFHQWPNEDEGFRGPGWHMHIADGDRELTLAIDPGETGTHPDG
jgi:hypothetical protein